MNAVGLHMRKLWPRYPWLPALPFTAWCVLMAVLGMLRWDHVAVAGAVAVLAYATPVTKRLLLAVVPFAGVGWLYDASRFVRDLGVTPDRVALCGLRELELRLFGTTWGGTRITWQDYFFVHHHPVADLIFAIPYGIFLYVSIAYALYLSGKDGQACARYSWGFLLLNVAGFVTYHLVPAAPPWYYHRYGCVVDLAAPSFEGSALGRVDAMLGVAYFRSFYGRASEIFGAIPSLHVAYPLLIIWEGWRLHGALGRGIALVYFASMCLAAVYLDHHWIVDIVLGWLYVLVTVPILRKLVPRAKSQAEPAMTPTPSSVGQASLPCRQSVR